MASSISEGYDDGSLPPPHTQDFASAMWQQRDLFPKLEIPWQLEYLCSMVALRGGCISEGQFDGMMPEGQLALYDDSYALGKLSWITAKDYKLPLSLLKRYFWHLASPTIPERQEALEAVKEGVFSRDVVQYAMDMPLHKRDVLGYIIGYIRKVGELRGDKKEPLDVIKVFASLLFKSSSNYNSRDNKMRIPPPIPEEVRFVQLLFRELDLDLISRKGARERTRVRSSSSAAPTKGLSFVGPPDAAAQV